VLDREDSLAANSRSMGPQQHLTPSVCLSVWHSDHSFIVSWEHKLRPCVSEFVTAVHWQQECFDWQDRLHVDTVKPHGYSYTQILFLNPTSLAKPAAVQLQQIELVLLLWDVRHCLLRLTMTMLSLLSTYYISAWLYQREVVFVYMRTITFCLCRFLNYDCLERSNLEIMWTEGIWNGNLFLYHTVISPTQTNLCECGISWTLVVRYWRDKQQK